MPSLSSVTWPRRPFVVCIVSGRAVAGRWKFWHFKPLTNQPVWFCPFSPTSQWERSFERSVRLMYGNHMWSFQRGAGRLVNLTVGARPDPLPSSPHRAAAWRVIAEPPCFDALDLYDLKSHSHFSDHKKRTYLVNCEKANIRPPPPSPPLPPYLISLWGQNAEKHFHFHSSVLISHLKAPSATINITAPTKRDATMRNYQQSQEAICFNVECVLLRLTASFLILWQLPCDSLCKSEGSVMTLC